MTTLLGKLLRLDVSADPPYRIPPDNPFLGRSDARPEIWALGLRNPWRFSFSPDGSTLYIADVGQNRWEEVNGVPAAEAGLNFGWAVREGQDCFGGSPCPSAGFADPVLVYGHDEGCSITGGFEYGGSDVPALVGRYLYADFCGGWIRGFLLANDTATDRFEVDAGSVSSPTSFGLDGRGELYLVTGGGGLYRFVAA